MIGAHYLAELSSEIMNIECLNAHRHRSEQRGATGAPLNTAPVKKANSGMSAHPSAMRGCNLDSPFQRPSNARDVYATAFGTGAVSRMWLPPARKRASKAKLMPRGVRL